MHSMYFKGEMWCPMDEMSSVTKWPSVAKIRNFLSSRFFIQSRVPPNMLTDIGSIWIGLGSDRLKILCRWLGCFWRFDVLHKVRCLCRAISWYIPITGRTVAILPGRRRVIILYCYHVRVFFFWKRFLERNVSRSFPKFDTLRMSKTAFQGQGHRGSKVSQ